MSILQISHDWIDFADGSDEPSIQATFAQVSIRIGEAKVTRLLDRRARSTREFTTIPLYPIAEWIVANWWCLFEEAEVPSRGISSSDYLSRHALKNGREGFAFPDLQFFPEGGWTLLKWAPSRSTYQLVEFLEGGQARAKTEQLQEVAADFVDSVIDRLEMRGISATWLQNEWSAIRAMNAQETDFCIAAGQLGLDPYQLDDNDAEEIVTMSQRLPKSIREEVLKASPRDLLATSVDWVEAGLLAVQTNTSVDGKWLALREKISAPPTEAMPWQSGYRLAQHLREVLRLGEAVSVDINDLVGAPFPIAHAITPPAASFDGLIGFGPSSLCCYTAKTREDSQRFLCARGLVHLLFDKSANTDFYSSAQSNIQQRNRAFAAEFLAPAFLIQKRMSGDEVSNEEVEDLAAQFRVSALVIDHQIRNHRLGKITGS